MRPGGGGYSQLLDRGSSGSRASLAVSVHGTGPPEEGAAISSGERISLGSVFLQLLQLSTSPLPNPPSPAAHLHGADGVGDDGSLLVEVKADVHALCARDVGEVWVGGR